LKYFLFYYCKVQIHNNKIKFKTKMSAIKNMSLFIPHVFPNFDQKYVVEAFSEIGDVERVDFVGKQDKYGNPFNAVYVHFKKWNDNNYARKIQDSIELNSSTKFYHDDTWYWIVLPNFAKKRLPGERKQRINIDDFKESESTNHKDDDEFEEYLELLRAPIEEWDTNEIDDEAQLAEIEAEMDAEDENLICIDWRYVHSIEQENNSLRYQLFQYQAFQQKFHNMMNHEALNLSQNEVPQLGCLR